MKFTLFWGFLFYSDFGVPPPKFSHLGVSPPSEKFHKHFTLKWIKKQEFQLKFTLKWKKGLWNRSKTRKKSQKRVNSYNTGCWSVSQFVFIFKQERCFHGLVWCLKRDFFHVDLKLFSIKSCWKWDILIYFNTLLMFCFTLVFLLPLYIFNHVQFRYMFHQVFFLFR